MTEEPGAPGEQREQWASRTGFLLAAIGSAIGLGNIWRFPYVAYAHGGGAFLLPYLVALLTAGIPLLILDYTLGHRYRRSPPAAFRALGRPLESLGWWQVGICLVVAVYYAVIIAWAVRYVGFSVGQRWGEDPQSFLATDFLRASPEPGAPGAYVLGVALPLVGIWLLTVVILAAGVRRGIERANRVFVPLLVVLFLALVVRALFLDGAARGLDAFFAPDWSALTDGSVWVAAYGQIFFSLSVGFGIMLTYASYLRRDADLTGTAMIAGFANSSFELLAGIGVFAAVGFMAAEAGIPVSEVATSGVGLAFVAFPQIISALPGGAGPFGVVFFASLVIAGLTSLVSIVQVIVSAVRDHTGLARRPAVLAVGGTAAALSLLVFPTDQGLYLLDTADHFVNQYGIALASLVVVVVVAWVLRRLPTLRAHANATSTLPLGRWWLVSLGVVTPLVLGWMMWDSVRGELRAHYGGYPTWLLLTAGWGVAAGVLVLGLLVPLLRRARQDDGPVVGGRGGGRAAGGGER